MSATQAVKETRARMAPGVDDSSSCRRCFDAGLRFQTESQMKGIEFSWRLAVAAAFRSCGTTRLLVY